jgi:hypothetical protein
VIIVGIRSDLAGRAADAEIAVSGMARTVRDVIETMPALRSGISRGSTTLLPGGEKSSAPRSCWLASPKERRIARSVKRSCPFRSE